MASGGGPPASMPSSVRSAIDSVAGDITGTTSTQGSSATATATTTGTGTATTGTLAAASSKSGGSGAQTVPSEGGASAVQSDPITGASTAFTTPTSSSNSAQSNDGQPLQQTSGGASGGMSSGAKIGVGVGVGIGVAVLLALVALFFIMRRRRKSRYNSNGAAEQMRGQPAMISTEPALAGASPLGRSPSYRSLNNRSSYHSLSPTGPPPMAETAEDPMPEATKGTIPAQPTIIPPSQQSLHLEPTEAQTPRSRRSMEAELVSSPGNESLITPAPPYDEAPSPMDEHPSRPVSPVSPVSSIGSRPPSLRRSFDS